MGLLPWGQSRDSGFKPNGFSSDVTFLADVPKDVIPLRFIAAVEEAALGAAQNGPLMGYPLIRVRIRLVGGSHSHSESTETAFAAATAEAFEKALEEAAPAILEPVMSFETLVPEANLGDVIQDMNVRRAEISEIGEDRGMRVLRGVVPLSRMFGYTTDLRSLTRGRGTSSIEPLRYQPVPRDEMKNMLDW